MVAFQRGAVFGLALGRCAAPSFGAIAQTRERRLEIVRDIVGDLLQAMHQRLDALKHDVEVFRQPVELIAGTGDRQPLAEIAGHDGAGGFRHRIDAAKHAAGDEQPAGQPQHDHDGDRPASGGDDNVIEPLALIEIAADQQSEAAGKLEHACQRVVLGTFRGLGFVEPVIGGLGPARIVEDAGLQRGDVSGQRLAGIGGDEIKARARAARTRIDHDHQAPDAAEPVLLRQAGDLGIDRLVDLFGDQAAGVEGEIAEQKRREQRKHGQIDQRQLERGGAEEFTERRHVSCIPRRGPCAEAAGRNLYRFSSASARCGRRSHWFAGRNGNPTHFPAAWCG